MILEKFLDVEKITLSPMGFLISIPNLGFRTYRQHSALIPSVADPHLKIGKIPVYSASPWIESLAHTVYDEYQFITRMIQKLQTSITTCIAQG